MVERPPEQKDDRYILRLYITGMTRRSMQAIANLKAVCEEYLVGQYDLEVIDIYQQPLLAKGDQIVATPTLIKQFPVPVRRLVGDLSQQERVLFGFDIRRKTV